MSLQALHESHIGRVEATFTIGGDQLDPATISSRIGLSPDRCARRGDSRRGRLGRLLSPHESGFWVLESAGVIHSKDVNDHIQYLLDILLPHRHIIIEFGQSFEIDVEVLWESTYLYAGTGPVLSPCVVRGIADLGAGLAFDIYQIEDPSSVTT